MSEIVVAGITKSFGQRKVLDQISFEVAKGQIHGLLGPNGAGKTTTLRIMTHLLAADAGSIRYSSLDGDKKNHTIFNHIGFLLESPALYPDMSVREFLTYLARLKRVSPKRILERVDYCIQALDLNIVANRSIENLSKGFKQRVGIASTLVHGPEILILDEPTVGLDPQSVVEVRNLILALKKDHTIILSSHLLHEMSLVCDQVTIISQGKILDTGSIEELRDKLAGKKSIELLVQHESAQLNQFIEQQTSVSGLEIKKENDLYHYQIEVSGADDFRTELLAMALKFETAPVGLNQQERDLEDIFIQMTGARES